MLKVTFERLKLSRHSGNYTSLLLLLNRNFKVVYFVTKRVYLLAQRDENLTLAASLIGNEGSLDGVDGTYIYKKKTERDDFGSSLPFLSLR